MEIKFQATENPKKKPTDESNLGFGQIFSDHIFVMKYREGEGWHDANIMPYENFSISPAATVFHYGQEVFEGLKAYRRADGEVNLFRSKDNFNRMNRSAKRIAMPPFDAEFVNNALHQLVALERDWVPESEGTSLYIRPNYMGVDPFIGVRAANQYIFYIMMGPVGAYYAGGLKPTRILVEKEYARAAKGGTGEAKTGGNYAASLIAGEEAAAKGCDQVLWLDADERKYVEEVGSMNIMFVMDDTIITPPLDGTILPGITRDSVLAIAKSEGMKVAERRITIDEVLQAAKSGALTEAFGTGTAAVISPVGELVYGDETVSIAGGKMGEKSQFFYDTLTGIQYGNVEDTYGWVSQVE